MKDENEKIYTSDSPEVIAPELPDTPELPARAMQKERPGRPGTRYRFRFPRSRWRFCWRGLRSALPRSG